MVRDQIYCLKKLSSIFFCVDLSFMIIIYDLCLYHFLFLTHVDRIYWRSLIKDIWGTLYILYILYICIFNKPHLIKYNIYILYFTPIHDIHICILFVYPLRVSWKYNAHSIFVVRVCVYIRVVLPRESFGTRSMTINVSTALHKSTDRSAWKIRTIRYARKRYIFSLGTSREAKVIDGGRSSRALVH